LRELQARLDVVADLPVHFRHQTAEGETFGERSGF
jgi:hypothetical protein